MNKIKIFYIQGDYPFCYYYRSYLPGVYSNQTIVKEFLRKDGDVSKAHLTEKALLSDVICFQRPSSKASYDLAMLLKQRGKKIIFDNDDSYTGIPLARLGNEKRVAIALELSKNLNDFVKISDGVTTSTQVLAEEYGKLNPNVAVLKNCIDPLDEMPCKKNDTGKFRIGIIGSVSSNDDCNHIRDQIRKLDARGDITIVILGLKFSDGKVMPGMQEDVDFWASLKNIEWHPVVFVTEYMMTVANLALDLIIIPRKEHYFNECKSNLKFLEASLLKIPVLAQGFSNGRSPYQDPIDSKYLSLVMDNSLWYDSIVKIKNSYDIYANLASEARAYVLENYNVQLYAPTWTETIKKLLDK